MSYAVLKSAGYALVHTPEMIYTMELHKVQKN